MSKLLSNKPKVIAIVGATASGKTAYSIELAKKIDAEIISADSRLVYKGMNIGTAKPTEEEKAGIPHHMIDIVEPEFEYSAALYKDKAEQLIEQITQKGKTPIVVGGTGLYIDILLKNYILPRIVSDKELRKELSELQSEEIAEILRKKDPDAFDIIDSNDRKKMIRAIEIINATGSSLANSRDIGEYKYDIEWIGRNYERKTLYEKIDKRVDLMVEHGLIEETKSLLKKHGRIPNIINTIGYREITGYIDNLYSLDEALELLKRNTRRYAKRQLTWFRRNENINWNVYPDKLCK